MNQLIPPDFQRGLIYTVHPRILTPIVPGEAYRILASTRIRLARHAQVPSYEPLYRRARLPRLVPDGRIRLGIGRCGRCPRRGVRRGVAAGP